ncbi:PEP-CTERM sorting domain-containing protein [Horticoccus luteus]|uniref:PEP-CTERM sorting domain-containing protein n=1 Tax=Horticoccus luteus TaxID=2862869 RepID=A0A8F9XKF3_9BACT|nr:PEP-CTERM sorting domain-containing protein [Horticoccus luteus]QYM78146.1 PEP-CTERM sorting domain-containing protein [Horticoccus luteus]
MNSIKTILLGVGAAVIFSQTPAFASPAPGAPIQTLESLFDNSGLGMSGVLDTNSIVGVGTMTYIGAPLGDGSYDFTSFDGLTLSFSFNGGVNFTEADMTTNASAVGLQIVIIGSTFQFAAAPNGISQGSAEFIHGTSDFFAVSPTGYPFYAYYVGAPTSPIYSGVYGAVNASPIPEPSSYAALLGAVALGAVVVRRRRRAVAQS